MVADLRKRLENWTTSVVQSPAGDLPGEDPLWEMVTTESLSLYYHPAQLAEVYRETDRTERQQETVACVRSFDRRIDSGRTL